ncbi:hypothetical protein FZEAL_4795 [Fusarium zealandicum]|uniref:Uncharacterized protein n=1 Tax=Fusarium zealandicum TaxID=1053134 RepID=A0A8H4XKG7_9HYPO|nr:hypothetical protein FZEAL_4795 [Fusarium zealandicum]
MPSGPWGRLRPVEQDPLQSMGLPSKGDGRLLDFNTQKWYYNQIMSRFLSFCTDSGERDELVRRFNSLDIRAVDPTPPTAFARPPPWHYASSSSTRPAAATSASSDSPEPSSSSAPSGSSSQAPPSASVTTTASSSAAGPSRGTPSGSSAGPYVGPSRDFVATIRNPDNTKPLQEVLMSLRKLREGIVATKRADDFAIQAYLFSIRLSILVKHPESYHPAILHLLRYIAVWQPMTELEIEEVAGYFMLDTACRRRDMAEAYFIRQDFKIKNKKLDLVLKALAHDNYVSWQRMKGKVDRHCLRLMEWADDEIRLQTLKCFSRSYLNVDLEFLEWATGRKWDELKEKDSVGWELDEGKVTIRRVRAK